MRVGLLTHRRAAHGAAELRAELQVDWWEPRWVSDRGSSLVAELASVGGLRWPLLELCAWASPYCFRIPRMACCGVNSQLASEAFTTSSPGPRMLVSCNHGIAVGMQLLVDVVLPVYVHVERLQPAVGSSQGGRWSCHPCLEQQLP